jgi:hypothetical protein
MTGDIQRQIKEEYKHFWPIQLQMTRAQLLYILENTNFFIRRVSEDLLLMQKLVERFLVKRKASDDEMYFHSVILLNKLEMLCEKKMFGVF